MGDDDSEVIRSSFLFPAHVPCLTCCVTEQIVSESSRPRSYSLATKGSKARKKVLSAETEEQVVHLESNHMSCLTVTPVIR